jgi:hypothetical protein
MLKDSYTTSKSGLSGADFKLAGVGEVSCDRNVGQQKILDELKM